jgi:DNA-binding transcriptional LysR family regulator
MDIGAIAAFVATAEGRSFTVAGRTLGITPSGVSKAVFRLETELQVRLFNRSTRSISLTAEGTSLFDRCRQILNDLEDAKRVVVNTRAAPSGRLRVSMPAIFGRLMVIPAMATFLKTHPLVSIECSVTDRMVDVVEEGFDVVVRIGSLPDSRLVARTLAHTSFVTCATPEYLGLHGVPSQPEDLRKHDCVQFLSPQTGRLMEWTFVQDGRAVSHSPGGAFSVDNGEALVDAALCDMGIVYVQDYMVAKYIRSRKLISVLDAFTARPTPIVALYPQNRHISPKVRSFVDHLAEQLADGPL